MSRYSGKCDLCDWVEISGGFEKFIQRNPTIYLGDAEEPISFTKESELMPYYPHIVSIGYHSDKSEYIRLMSTSWVDHEEREYGHHKIHDYYRQRLAMDIEEKKREELELESNMHIG